MSASELQIALSDRLFPTGNTIEPLKANREVKNPTRFGQYFTHSSVIDENKEPFSYKQALKSSSAEKWLDAMQEEVQSLNENETWSLVKARYDKKIVPGKWVFKIKRNEHGVAEKYKAKFVAKGFAQTDVLEFGETFAPTRQPETFRLVLALAAQHNLHLEQLDVKSAFLRAKTKEEVFIEQPEGFAKDGTKLVCKLKISIYGLQQASKNWYDRLKTLLLDGSFQRSKNDYYLYVKNELIYVPVWVDDIIVASCDFKQMKSHRKI